MLKLVMGNRNYSSWSLRAWLVLAQTGAPFDEQLIPLDLPGTAEEIRRSSPSGRVPCLVADGLVVWDSLAIAEYLHERFPAAQLWPADAAARAVARSISAEMHAGFTELRTRMPMDIRQKRPGPERSPALDQDVARVQQIWRECRERFGQGGPFLFGPFGIADAMYAPVVTRFRTYGVALEGEPARYAEAVWRYPAMQRWVEGARQEPWEIEHP